MTKSAALLLSLLAIALAAAGCGASTPDCTDTTQGVSTTSGAGTTVVTDAVLAPEVSGVTLAGTTVSSSEYRGRPLVLAFMASW